MYLTTHALALRNVCENVARGWHNILYWGSLIPMLAYSPLPSNKPGNNANIEDPKAPSWRWWVGRRMFPLSSPDLAYYILISCTFVHTIIVNGKTLAGRGDILGSLMHPLYISLHNWKFKSKHFGRTLIISTLASWRGKWPLTWVCMCMCPRKGREVSQRTHWAIVSWGNWSGQGPSGLLVSGSPVPVSPVASSAVEQIVFPMVDWTLARGTSNCPY